MNAPQLRSARLKIVAMEMRDALSFFRYRSDFATHEFVSFAPKTLKDAEEFLSELEKVRFDTPDTWFQFGVFLADSQELIGDLGVHFVDENSQQVEIGYTFDPDYQGQGFATEAVQALLEYLFVVAKKHRVYASVDPRNQPSLALLSRVGMRQEAHHRESLWFKEQWVDDIIYAMLRAEYCSPDATKKGTND